MIKRFLFFNKCKKEIFSGVMKMESLKLVPQIKLNSRINEPVMLKYVDSDSIKKTLNDLIKSMEKLEDKINEIEYKLKNHINTFDDIAHKI
jgi:hypothetical protein